VLRSLTYRVSLLKKACGKAQHARALYGCAPVVSQVLTRCIEISDYLAARVPGKHGRVAAELGAEAATSLGLVLLQQGETEAAERLLATRSPGLEWRLSDEVMIHSGGESAANSRSPHRGVAALNEGVAVFDDALPHGLYHALENAFAPTSAFWRDHGYCPEKGGCGFFSYVHALRGGGETGLADSSSAITVLAALAIQKLMATALPGIAGATHVEWWAHCRPHGCGHQLHYDSDDEGRGAGGPRHPLASSVIYLSDEGCGGPTLVTSQRRQDTLLRLGSAAAVSPKRNRALAFDGSLLHAVIPGCGQAADPTARRVTLMIAFWDSLTTVRPLEAAPASAVTFPSPQQIQLQWPRAFYAAVECRKDNDPKPVRPQHVDRLWTPLHVVPKAANAVPLPPYEACFQGF